MFHILVVCTANMCRSPAAQLILLDCLQGLPVRVDSAGTAAQNNFDADAGMVSSMLSRGYQGILDHRSKMLLPSHLMSYDLILCMENTHIKFAEAMQVNAKGKVKLLGHWSNAEEVPDPVGRSKIFYEQAIDQMQTMAKQWSEKIILLGL
jgi:protein-tyrosine phosphatase